MAKKKFFDKKEEVKENKEMEEKEVNAKENKVEEALTEEVKESETEVQTNTGDVATDEPSVESPETKVGKLSNCELLNARKEPNKDSEVLFVVGKEDKIVILEEENDFYKVSVNNKEAYCMKNFIVVE